MYFLPSFNRDHNQATQKLNIAAESHHITMAATTKNTQEIEKAKKLNHVPWCDEYEKMISGMLYDLPCTTPHYREQNIKLSIASTRIQST